MAKRLATFVTVDGVQYGPDSDLPAEVVKAIENPDAWETDDEDDKKPPRKTAASK